MNNCQILACFLLLIQVTNVEAKPFPKLLWVYWDQGFDSAPLFVRFCYHNLKRHAQASGWEFRPLSAATAHQYINMSLVESTISKHYLQNIQGKSDLIRVQLMIHYGGMWVDAKSYFVRGLDWTDNPKGSPYLANQLSEAPEIIVSATRTEPPALRYDIHTKTTVEVYPCLQNWFLVAHPNCSFFIEWWKTIEEGIALGMNKFNETIISEGIRISQEVREQEYFMLSDFCEEVVIHRMQKKLDSELHLYSQATLDQDPRLKYGVAHYGIWHMESSETAFSHYQYHEVINPIVMWMDLSHYSTAALLEDKGQAEPPLFYKFPAHQTDQFEKVINNYAAYSCWDLQEMILPSSELFQELMAEQVSGELADHIREVNQAINDPHFCSTFVEKRASQKSLTFILPLFFNCVLPVLTAAVYFWMYGFLLFPWKQEERIDDEERELDATND